MTPADFIVFPFGVAALLVLRWLAVRKLRTLERKASTPPPPATYSFVAAHAMAEAEALINQVNRFTNDLVRAVNRNVETLLKEGHVVEVHGGTQPVRYGKGAPTAIVRIVPENGAIRIVVEKKQ